jgi:alkylation response protein AidB-like acyl-CoA dehydrogenase
MAGGGLPHHRPQAVDQQRRVADPLHHSGQRPWRAHLVRHRKAEPRAFQQGKPEDKHGIRASNTAALFLEDVYVPADRLVGLVEGQGLAQAQAVFGYTRLMVGAFGLGAGWEALRRAIRYSQSASRAARRSARSRATPTS